MREPMIRALVVEDEPMILKYIVKKINELDKGFEVIDTAINGQEALKKIYELRPDVVYTDIRMPVMDGIALVKNLRVSFPDMPVVILSGYSDFEYMQQCIELSVDAYLLKPIQVTQLSENLEKIRKTILGRKKMLRKEILASGVCRGQMENNLPSDFSEENFQVILINIGNLSNGILHVRQTEGFLEIWRRIPWERLLDGILAPEQEWWVLDEHLVNQKIIFLANNRKKDTVQKCGEMLFTVLSDYVEGLPVTVVYSMEEANYSQIKNMADHLRRFMQNRLVPCVSQLICRDTFSGKGTEEISEKEWKALLLEQDRTNQREIFWRLMDSWRHKKVSQRDIMRTLEELLTGMKRKGTVFFQEDVQELMCRIDQIFVMESDANRIYEEIWSLVEDAQYGEECKQLDAEEIAQCVREYLEQHYEEEISLSQLAEKFHFTSAYLSKIYKKYMKETPLKHLTYIRIEKAKQLLKEHMELTVQEIAGIVGYEEFHYFYRVFKNTTGMTPTEYREKTDQKE